MIRSGLSDADLTICGLDPAVSARRALLASAAGGGTMLLILGSVFRPISPLSLTGVIVGCLIGPMVETRLVRARADRRRNELEMSLASYLDLANVLIAGGAGLETALLAAAEAGDGWTFDLLRNTLRRAHARRVPFWQQLHQAGVANGLDSLVETAHTMRLAGEHGSRIRRSLSVKATTLRARQLARLEHDANQGTEHMGLPMVMIFLGFVALLGYPALTTTVGAL